MDRKSLAALYTRRAHVRRALLGVAVGTPEADDLEAEWLILSDAIEAGERELEPLPSVPRRRMMGHMYPAGDSRALKISKSKGGKTPEVRALNAAGMTPQEAADLCGTTRDVLKQAWARGKQFRPMRPEWKKILAAKGVPIETWREK